MKGVGVEHFYRTDGKEKFSFTVSYKNSNILVKSNSDIEDEFSAALRKIYTEIETHGIDNPQFLKSFVPLEVTLPVPRVVREMYAAAAAAGTGPMAAVAGGICEELYRTFSGRCRTLIIENGGDIFMGAEKDIFCGLYTGGAFDGFGLKISKGMLPCGVSSSSSEIGHSVSFGKARLATVAAASGAVSDAFATALANAITSQDSLAKAVEKTSGSPGVIGALGIFEDKIAFSGKIDFVKTKNSG